MSTSVETTKPMSLVVSVNNNKRTELLMKDTSEIERIGRGQWLLSKLRNSWEPEIQRLKTLLEISRTILKMSWISLESTSPKIYFSMLFWHDLIMHVQICITAVTNTLSWQNQCLFTVSGKVQRLSDGFSCEYLLNVNNTLTEGFLQGVKFE